MFKKNLIMTFLVVAVTGSMTIKESSIFSESSTEMSYKKGIINNLVLSVSNKIDSKVSNVENSNKKNANKNTKKTNKYENVKVEQPNNKVITATNDTSKTENTTSVVNVEKTDTISKSDQSNNNENKPSSIDVNSKTESTNTSEKEDKKTNTTSTSEVNLPTIYYDRTTSIYDNDNKTLLRIEYYVNNKLTYYSYIEQFDVTTRSYIEKICKWNYEKNKEVLVRTDVYSNGKLINSY